MSGCLCNRPAGAETTAEKKVAEVVNVPAKQLYYTNYKSSKELGETNPIYPKTHSSVVMYKDTGVSIEDVLEKLTLNVEKNTKDLSSMGKHHLRIADDLVTDSTVIALSARQGGVLKDRIGDLTQLKSDAKTDLVTAYNELYDAFAALSEVVAQLAEHN